MWPFGGLTLVTFGLAPSALHWLIHRPETVWHAAACYALVDTAFVLGAFLFLYIGVRYGESRSQARPAPYPGAWVEHDGHQQTPRGFAPGYLSFALVVSLIVPALVLLASSGPARPFVFATLGPYLLVFLPQVTLETKYLSRSFMTPVLPVLFMYYRLWQFMRSLQLVAGTSPQDGGPTWLRWYLLSLLAFWVFDTGCTMIWLPWMYDWQLQDAALLQQLAEHRQQQHPEHNILLQQAKAALAKKSDGVAGMSESTGHDAATPVHGMTTRSRARTPAAAAAGGGATAAAAATNSSAGSAGSRRKRAAAAYPEGTDNIDSFGFGA